MKLFLSCLAVCLVPACCAASAELKLTVLYDNTVLEEGLQAEWGFACLVEGLEKTILFDAGGKGDVLLENAEKLGVDLGGVDVLVISHDHGDHYGGAEAFLDRNPDVDVYMLETFLPDRLGMAEKHGARLVAVSGPVEVCHGAKLTGSVGTQIPEQAIVLDTAEGPVVITGCAHPGVVAMVEKGGQVVGEKVGAVLGGFHLIRDSEESVEGMIGSLKALGVRRAGATHCTGERAIEQFARAFGEGAIKMGVGKRLVFPLPAAKPVLEPGEGM